VNGIFRPKANRSRSVAMPALLLGVMDQRLRRPSAAVDRRPAPASVRPGSCVRIVERFDSSLADLPEASARFHPTEPIAESSDRQHVDAAEPRPEPAQTTNETFELPW